MMFFPVVVLSSQEESPRRPQGGEGFTEEIAVMAEAEASGSQGWRSSLSLPSSEDVARAVAAAATAVSSPRPSVVFSSHDDGCNSPLRRIQNQVSKVLKGFSQSSDRRSLTYNPEVLTKQKRQWASFQLESLDHRSFKEPSNLFESMVVVGLPPSFDDQELRKRLLVRKSEGSGKFRIALSGYNRSRVEPNFEPQVLFVYPPEKQLPLQYRDLLSFCFPGGVEVHAVEKSASMSELNEILLGQEHLKQSELSFMFRLQQGADNSTLYGCCILMEELVDRPSRLISLISDSQPVSSCLGRYIFTTKRCYCILSRVPFFELHFGVLRSIFMEERLERLTKSISVLDLEVPDTRNKVEGSEENSGMNDRMPAIHVSEDEKNETAGTSLSSSSGTTASTRVADIGSHLANSDLEGISSSFRDDTDESLTTASYERDILASDTVVEHNFETSEINSDNPATASTRVTDIGSHLANSDLEGISSAFRDDTDESLTTASYERDILASDTVVEHNSETSEINSDNPATASTRVTEIGSHLANSDLEGISSAFRDDTDESLTTASYERDILASDTVVKHNSETSEINSDNPAICKPTMEKSIPDVVWPLLRYQQFESSELSCSQGAPCEERQLRSENDETDIKETSISGQEDFSSHSDILEWAKANNHGSLQIICQYYKVDCPPRGSSITFHPLEHLHPLEFHRPSEKALDVCGSPLDLRSCRTSLERVEVLNALISEEEATSLSVVTLSCICGFLRLEHILTLFAGALLEKQIIFVCSNLGILSASVLSLIPLIRPYHWQSLLMPVLPNDMLDFLDAPVPYIVGVQSKSSEVHSKSTSAILVDISKNQVKSQSMPQLPQQWNLLASLAPFHSKLVGESYLGKKRPIYECTDAQVEAAKGFMGVLKNYLDSLCSNLRSHTITNVQSNDDKVSLLLKESFIDSFPIRDRPFMKLFVDTQLFSVHTDLVLSFYQKD